MASFHPFVMFKALECMLSVLLAIMVLVEETTVGTWKKYSYKEEHMHNFFDH